MRATKKKINANCPHIKALITNNTREKHPPHRLNIREKQHFYVAFRIEGQGRRRRTEGVTIQ
jgi:hypothetical protein